MAKYKLWKSSNDNLYYWHLYSDRNNEIVCWAEGYSTRQAALNSIEWVRNNAPNAPLAE